MPLKTQYSIPVFVFYIHKIVMTLIPDDFQLATKKQPLSLLATAIRILERRPKEQPRAPNGYPSNHYTKQVRPQSAYVVLKKPTQSSSTLNSSHQSSIHVNGVTPKQQKQIKTKQNLYMSLIHPPSARDPRYGMTVPSRIRTPMDYHVPVRQPKANTLPRPADGKRMKVNRKLYMDMIRPIMTSPQYLKLGATRSNPPLPLTQRNISRQSQPQHTRFTPRPPNDRQILRRLDPNSSHQKQLKGVPHREEYRPRREEYTPVSSRPSTTQRHTRNAHNLLNNSISSSQRDRISQNSLLNNSVSSSSHKDLHFPHITRKTRDDVSLNSSLKSKRQIPGTHPDNITPLYFRKSLAYSPHYEHKEMLSSPLPSMNT